LPIYNDMRFVPHFFGVYVAAHFADGFEDGWSWVAMFTSTWGAAMWSSARPPLFHYLAMCDRPIIAHCERIPTRRALALKVDLTH